MLSFTVLIASATLQADTTVVFGVVQRDLTGDGNPETLRLIGVGSTVDSLAVTFSIESFGTIVYRVSLAPLTRTVGIDAGAHIASAAEHRERLKEFGPGFFHESKFRKPSAFVRGLHDAAPGRVAEVASVIARDGGFGADTSRAAAIWNEIQRRDVTIFEFSPGGDAVVAIGWSAAHR